MDTPYEYAACTGGKMEEQRQVHLIIEKLEHILQELDTLRLYRPAIKVSHAIDCLKESKSTMES